MVFVLDEERGSSAEVVIEKRVMTQRGRREVGRQALARGEHVVERDGPRRRCRLEVHRSMDCRSAHGIITSLGTGVTTRNVVTTSTMAANASSADPVSRKRRVSTPLPPRKRRRARSELYVPMARTSPTNASFTISVLPYIVGHSADRLPSLIQLRPRPASTAIGAQNRASGWKEFTSALTAACLLPSGSRSIAGTPAKRTINSPPTHTPAAATCSMSSVTLRTKCRLDAA